MINFYKKGITVIEILVVIAVIAVLASVMIPQFSKNREMQVLKTGVEDILSSIDKARAETLSSLNSSSYGVHFQSDKVIIFKGTSFSANDSSNETINIIAPAKISSITLSGVNSSSGEIYFNRLSGAPSKTGSVTMSTNSYSRIINIYATGVASSN